MMGNKSGITKFVGILPAVLLLLFILGACAPQGGSRPDGGQARVTPPAPGEAEGSGRLISLPVYYVKYTDNDIYLVREVHQVPDTGGDNGEIIKAALEELIRTDPVTPGAARVLPEATKVRSVTVRDGTATVDFSREVLRANVGASGEAMGLQSIINTVTEYPGVRQVTFLVEGKLDEAAKNWWGHVGLYEQPFARDVSRVYEPAIWVTSPAPGQVVAPPLVITGSARVFEATVNARLRDAHGKEMAFGFATAAQGAPGRGDFTLSLDFQAVSPGKGQVEVFWPSPADGAEEDKVIIPVSW